MKHETVLAGIIGLAAAIPAIGCSNSRSTQFPAPPPAPRSCQVALAPGPQTTEIDRTIRELQERVRQPRGGREALEQLGYQYVTRARVNNDPGDYTLAESAASCLESRHPNDAAALLVRGHALHQLHRFKDAEAIARRLVAAREFVLDYGLLGDALMEQGRLAEAAVSYQHMIDLKPFYQSYTRAAHLRWLKGDVEGAIDLMNRAIASASPQNRESIAWAYARLALYQLQRGHLVEASNSADSALSTQSDYPAALLARGRILLARNRPADAVASLRRAAALNPLPEYQWALAEALRFGGLVRDAEAVERDLISAGSRSDPRTLALFLATRRVAVDTALDLTERELLLRADVFTQDARAWALAAAGRIAEARAAIGRALAENTQDARLFLHAGVIALASGNHAAARRWLARAEALHATLLPSELDELHRSEIAGTAIHTGE